MADLDFTLTATPLLGGAKHQIGENQIVERDDLALVSIATPLGGDAALAKALDSGWGLTMPEPTVSSVAQDIRAIRTGPDQLILIFPHATPDARAFVQAKIGEAGYTTDQTDVWVALEISGPDTLAALERLCPLDVARFAEGGSARTVMEHMGAMIVHLSGDRFLLLSASSSAQSFLHAVELSYRYVTG